MTLYMQLWSNNSWHANNTKGVDLYEELRQKGANQTWNNKEECN